MSNQKHVLFKGKYWEIGGSFMWPRDYTGGVLALVNAGEVNASGSSTILYEGSRGAMLICPLIQKTVLILFCRRCLKKGLKKDGDSFKKVLERIGIP